MRKREFCDIFARCVSAAGSALVLGTGQSYFYSTPIRQSFSSKLRPVGHLIREKCNQYCGAEIHNIHFLTTLLHPSITHVSLVVLRTLILRYPVLRQALRHNELPSRPSILSTGRFSVPPPSYVGRLEKLHKLVYKHHLKRCLNHNLPTILVAR